MKKLLLASLMLATTAFAQTKKVIIEDYTGLNCGWCPEGTVILEGLQSNASCLPIAMHGGSFEPTTSPLRTPEVNAIISAFTVTSFPGGCVNRVKYPTTATTLQMGRGSWSPAYNVEKAKTAIASVSFSGKVDKGSNNYEFDLNVIFSSLPTAGVPIAVQVYVIEDSIAATGVLAQDNYSSSVQGGASPLNPWFHNRTFRKSADGTAFGYTTVIPATPVVGTKYTKHIAITMNSAWVRKNIRLIAYVAYNGTSIDQKEIMNAEETSLTSFFKTGVENLSEPVKIYGAYPNPATVNDVVKVEFNMNTTGNVKMDIYNSIGQLVATPFNSFETEGTHTMQWKASDLNLTPGVYIMQIATAEGKQTQRITIQ